MLYGVKERKGLILITGEVGTGKTTLCKTFLNVLPQEVKTSLILNPYFSEVQLLKAIVEDFGLNIKGKGRLDIVKGLNSFLLEQNRVGGNAVLIVDEAQDLGARQLEQIRLLSNLETAAGKLLQIVLAGQPELDDKLSQFSLRQIRQRICVHHTLTPLRLGEVKKYIEHRLKKAGDSSIEIMPQSYDVIYKFSGGIPRLINMLCDRVLLCGFAHDKKIFDPALFKICIEELEFPQTHNN